MDQYFKTLLLPGRVRMLYLAGQKFVRNEEKMGGNKLGAELILTSSLASNGAAATVGGVKNGRQMNQRSKPIGGAFFAALCSCLLVMLIALLAPGISVAQTNRLILEGNELYNQQRYDEATKDYMKALQKDPNNATGLFNLGNSLYQSKQFDSSRKIMTATANALKDKSGKSAADYNIGNTYMAQKKWEDAVSAYKNTLRNNPQDADAKYNLSYAEQMMKKDQQNGGGKNDKKNQQQDKKDQQKDKQQQDKNDKDKSDKDKQQQDQQNQDKDQKPDKDAKPQGQPSKLSQQQADQLLNALQQEEKKLQDKLKKEKGIPVKLDKDW